MEHVEPPEKVGLGAIFILLRRLEKQKRAHVTPKSHTLRDKNASSGQCPAIFIFSIKTEPTVLLP